MAFADNILGPSKVGDSGDHVRLDGAFTDAGTEEVDGTSYNVYSFDGTEARLLAETDVTVAAASV